MSVQDDLKDIVSNGIILDIFNAEEAFALEEFIGTNAEAVNEATFGAFFGSMQLLLNRQLILSLARLFEAPNKRFLTRSIPVALELMEANSDTLSIPERPTLIKYLAKFDLDTAVLNNLDDQSLTGEVIKLLKTKIPQPIKDGSLIDQALHATQTIRNKSIAHPESIPWSELPKPTYNDLKELIEIAKGFVSLIGLPYLSTVYCDDNGDYLLSSDATRSTRCLKRIFERLSIPTEDNDIPPLPSQAEEN